MGSALPNATTIGASKDLQPWTAEDMRPFMNARRVAQTVVVLKPSQIRRMKGLVYGPNDWPSVLQQLESEIDGLTEAAECPSEDDEAADEEVGKFVSAIGSGPYDEMAIKMKLWELGMLTTGN